MNRWREKLRSKKYCHHDLPCYCGLRPDPKFRNQIDPSVFAFPSDLTEEDRRQIRGVL